MIKVQSRLRTLLLAIVVGVIASPSVWASATITIQNSDGPNSGFNDSTAATPVGGNNGTTVGQQRLNAFMFAAGIWGATINSGPTIRINASWAALTCDATSAVLGSAGSVGMRRDFPNAPFGSTWYSTALANAISGSDQNGSTAEISAQFNMNIGKTGCLQNSFWYYGLDGNAGNGIDLVTVLLHEFAHGLGFQTFTDGSSGALSGGFPTVFDRFLRDDTTGKLWVNMTNAERAASAINNGNLVWAGPQVTADVPIVLGGTPRIRVSSPPALAGNFNNIGTAQFGPPLTSHGVTAPVVGTSPVDACSAVGGAVLGKIAFVNRGSCNFTVKVKNAQNAGALAVIVGNVSTSVSPTIAPDLGGTDPTITIPSVGLNQADADSFRAQLGNSIIASILVDANDIAGADSANRAQMYAPSSFQPTSSVSHFDTSMLPNQLMEPNNSSDLTHSVMPWQDLTLSLLRDIGWTANATMQIMLEEAGPDPNQSASLDAILFLRDPFQVVNGSNIFSLPADPNTRVFLFVTNLQLAQGEPASAVTVNLIDSLNQTYNITAQDVRPVPNLAAFTQVTFRLPDNLPVGTCQITVIAHGLTSNTASFRIES